MLSIHTNTATNAGLAALSRTSQNLATSMTKLSTGYRINSAMDDAAGLQIATRLNAQNSGTKVAMRNIQNGISMLQTFDSVLGGLIDVYIRMRDLATQAADGSTTLADKVAIEMEFEELYSYHWQLMDTKYNGEGLILDSYTGSNDSKFLHPITFQIGASSAETMTVDFLQSIPIADLGSTWGGWGVNMDLHDLIANRAGEAISSLETGINGWATIRSAIGATANRLEHAYNNAAQMSMNSEIAHGGLMDVDFATESANMTMNQMLMQAGNTMLKEQRTTAGLIISLLQ
jgi:flagellin